MNRRLWFLGSLIYQTGITYLLIAIFQQNTPDNRILKLPDRNLNYNNGVTQGVK